jgi:RNA polymerase sigma-54 factor
MINQSLQQRLQQKLSPQQIQLVKLLEVPTFALEERIKQELEENPALEITDDEDLDKDNLDEKGELEDEEKDESEVGVDEVETEDYDLSEYYDEDETPAYKLSLKNDPNEERKDIPFTSGVSFSEYLISQLGLQKISDRQNKIGVYIIGNIDDTGYLQRELSLMVNDIAFSQNITTNVNELESVLYIIQELDPPGVGARNLQECLSIQLNKKDDPDNDVENAKRIINKCFEEFTRKHYEKICKKLSLSEQDLKMAINQILKLNPKPGNSYNESSRSNQYIIPDFTITNNDGKLELTLNSRNAPDLKINRSFNEIIETYSSPERKAQTQKQKDLVVFVKQKLDSAKWFIDMIKQRQNTLYSTMSAIMEYQKEYFLDGDETMLKPMILKDIAEIVKLDISTISRVANSKYVQTSFGTLPLKSFFSESMSTDSGDEVSSREIKKILSDCIDEEDKRKPLTDDELAKILKSKSFIIARRTVAKYREQLGIPIARLRKKL